MSTFITGSFNLNEFDYNPIVVGQFIDQFVEDYLRPNFVAQQVMPDVFSAEVICNEINLSHLNKKYTLNQNITVGKDSYARIVASDGNFVSLKANGQITFYLCNGAIDIFTTGETFLGLPKELLRQNINGKKFGGDIFVVTDPTNFLIVQDIEDSWHGRKRQVLETTEEWLNRSHGTPDMIEILIKRLVDDTVTVYEVTEKKLTGNEVFPDIEIIMKSLERKQWVDDIRVAQDEVLKHIEKYVPNVKEILDDLYSWGVITKHTEHLDFERKQKHSKDLTDKIKLAFNK